MSDHDPVEPPKRPHRRRDLVTQVQGFRITGSIDPNDVREALESSRRASQQAPAPTAVITKDTRIQTGSDALRHLTSAQTIETDDALEMVDTTEAPGRYVEVEELGRGGMGQVYRVTDQWLGRDVAMKLLHPDAGDSREHIMALRREARIIGGLEHPSIIPVHELGTRPDGAAYYTMKLVAHTSLGEVLGLLELGDPDAMRRYGVRQLVDIFIKIAQAMEYAHRSGVVHRDLKPENVLLGEFGEVQVMDWGIAKRMGGPRPEGAEGLLVGTPAYMSPEQAAGHDSLTDHRSDIYSLGVMLYEVLALRRPFSGETSQQQLEATKHLTPLPPSTVARDRAVPQELDVLVMRMLEKDRDARPQSMHEVWEALDAFLAGQAERERRRLQAEESFRRAQEELQLYHAMQTERTFLHQEVHHLGRMVRPWDEQSHKQQLDELRHRLQVLDVLYAHAFATVTELLRDAIEANGHEAAREHLVAMYWARHDEAEADEDSATKLFFARLAHDWERDGDDGEDKREGTLHVRSQPAGATVYAVPFAEYRDGEPLRAKYELGRTPVVDVRLPVGPYVLIARIDGYRDAQEALYLREHTQDLLLLCDPWSVDFPLIGREVELARLWSLLDDIEVRSRPVTCVVEGAPGMGKNLLLDAFRAQVKAHPTRLYLLMEVTCAPLRYDLPYAVVVAMVRSRAAVLPEDSAQEMQRKVRRMVYQAFTRFGQRQMGDDERQEADRVAAAIAALPAFDLDDPARSATHRELSDRGRVVLTHALATYFQRLSVSAPVLMLIRNAQYMDSASRSFFRDLLKYIQGAPILVVASASALGRNDLPRPGAVRTRTESQELFPFDEQLTLSPLNDLAQDQLVRELLAAPVNHKLLAWIRANAAGNPFMAAELIALVSQRRAMQFDGGEWRLVREHLPDIEIGDLNGVVRGLLHTLPGSVRETLSSAVVVGRVFWTGAVEQLVGGDPSEALALLEQRGFIDRRPTSRYANEVEYQLTSSLRWRVSYDMHPPQRRRAFHRLTAAWMAQQGRTDLEEALAIAYHLEMGGQPAEAVVLLMRAARAAQTAGAYDEATRLYTRIHILTDDLKVKDAAEAGIRKVQVLSNERKLFIQEHGF